MGSLGPQTVDLPVIDLNDRSPENGKRIVEAASKFGFLYVSPVGTDLTDDLIDQEFELSKRFFALPLEEKEQCVINKDNQGWTGMHNEILDPANQRLGDFKEALNLGEFTSEGQPVQQMPPSFRNPDTYKSLYTFEQACAATRDRILDLLALGLEIEDEKWFSKRHGLGSKCTMRLLHYPSIPADVEYDPEVDIRAGAHSDYGSITLLFQRPSQPGLEIRPPDDSDRWLPVAVFPPNYPSTRTPPILVNIADLMSYWTGGLLKSTVHRVIFPKDSKGGKDRYSIAYFVHPIGHVQLEAVPSPLVQAHLRKTGGTNGPVGYGGGAADTDKKALTAHEHLMNRLNATYQHVKSGEKFA